MYPDLVLFSYFNLKVMKCNLEWTYVQLTVRVSDMFLLFFEIFSTVVMRYKFGAQRVLLYCQDYYNCVSRIHHFYKMISKIGSLLSVFNL